jgi:hypothetical protein
MKLVKELQKTSKPTLMVAGIILLCVVGFLDYYTGYELSFSLFYLIPVAMLSWVTNSRVGIAVSIISAGIWLAADIESGAHYSSPAIYFWNTMIRFGFFLLMVFVIKVVKGSTA